MFLKNYININIIFLLLYSKKKININSYAIEKNNLLQNNVYLNIFNFINLYLFKIMLNFKKFKFNIRLYVYSFWFLYKNNFLNFLVNFNKINMPIKSHYLNNINNFYFNDILLSRSLIYLSDVIYFFKFYKNNEYIYFKKYNFNFKKYNFNFFFFNKISTKFEIYNFVEKYDLNHNYIFLDFYSNKSNNMVKFFKVTSPVLLQNNINFINYFYKNSYKKITNNFIQNSNYNLNLFKYYTLNYNVKQTNVFTSYLKSFFFFEIFLKKFFELKYDKYVYLTFKKNNVCYLSNNVYYLSLIRRLKKLQIFSKQTNLIKEIVEILILTFFTHDIILFKNWLINVCEKLHFKSHKKLFYILKVIIIKYFNLYFKYFGCLGFCLKINGKIGLGGSSKTKNFWIKVGKFSLSRKNLKIGYTSGSIRTYSGILGVEFILSYI